ncbi:MAG TPA: DUF2079 domain-containing protein, partial [Polyangia bacterium]
MSSEEEVKRVRDIADGHESTPGLPEPTATPSEAAITPPPLIALPSAAPAFSALGSPSPASVTNHAPEDLASSSVASPEVAPGDELASPPAPTVTPAPPPRRRTLTPVAPSEPGITVVIRSFILLGLEGLSVGLAAWGVQAAWRMGPYAKANEISARGRVVLLADMFGVALGACLLAAIYLLWRRRAGIALLDALSRRLLPLIVVGALPFLFNWAIWQDRDITFLVLAAIVGLGLQPLMTRALLGPPVITALPRWGQRISESLHSFRGRHATLLRRLPFVAVCLGVAIYAVFFSYHTVINHLNIRTTSLDLALEENVIWNALHGGPLFKSSPYTGPTGTHGGNHFTLLAYVLALPYFFAQRAETLLVLQAFLLGAAA